jgi:hypothetical protein
LRGKGALEEEKSFSIILSYVLDWLEAGLTRPVIFNC